MKRVISLLQTDGRNLIRDPMLVLVTCIPLFVAMLMRFLIPWGTGMLGEYLDFNLNPYYPFITSFFLLLAPLMYGWVIGFMLLDERDENILQAISVTPLGKTGFLTYRMVLPVIISFGMSFGTVAVLNLIPFNAWQIFPAAILAAMEAPILVLVLAAFANNKVEGVALGKGISISFIAPFAVLFVEPPLQFIAGVLPPYWVTKLFVETSANPLEYGLFLMIGLLVHGIILLLVLKIFNRRVG